MNWKKLIYVLIIALLYVPMVFLGANVFFPEYTGSEGYFHTGKECYPRFAPPERLPVAEQQKISELQQSEIEGCLVVEQEERRVWEEGRAKYDGNKYVAIIAFNLLMLLIVLFITLKDAVLQGLFVGVVVTVFGATVSYWDYARSKIGFGLLLIIFFLVLYFINKTIDRTKSS